MFSKIRLEDGDGKLEVICKGDTRREDPALGTVREGFRSCLVFAALTGDDLLSPLDTGLLPCLLSDVSSFNRRPLPFTRGECDLGFDPPWR